MLTREKIQELAGMPNVRKIAVENFLGSMSMENPLSGTYMNLDLDAWAYHWNKETIAAIETGIAIAYA